MVATKKRAPRVVGERTNMAAASAAALSSSSSDTADFASAWFLVWQALGGVIHQGSRGSMLGVVAPFEPISTMVGSVRVVANTPAERDGARNALAAMLRIAGRPAIEAVMAFGTIDRGIEQ